MVQYHGTQLLKSLFAVPPLVLQASWQVLVSEDSAAAEDVLLEVQRLWPPFLGGARVCTKVYSLLTIEALFLQSFPLKIVASMKILSPMMVIELNKLTPYDSNLIT